jgi:hypothetical protein
MTSIIEIKTIYVETGVFVKVMMMNDVMASDTVIRYIENTVNLFINEKNNTKTVPIYNGDNMRKTSTIL